MRVMLADMYNLLGESGKAAQIYTEMLKKMPDVPLVQERLRAKLADIYLRSPDRSKAAEQLEAILQRDPTNAQAYYLLGSIRFEEKKNQEAVDNFRKTILLKPDFDQAYYDLATAEMNLGKSQDALATLESARKKFQQNFVLEFLTGMAYSRLKAFPEAMKYFTSAEVFAQATEPKRLNEFFYFQLGATSERKGDYAQAEKYFLKTLELAPNFAEALNYYGYMLAERGEHLDKARDLIEKALKLEPKNGAFLDSMGWVLFRLNQPTEALEYIQQAVKFTEEPDATLYDHLGDILSALGRANEAREAWKKSLELEKNEQVQKKLEAPSQ
jgi:tetratricopeptide (TPR) repeat protein